MYLFELIVNQSETSSSGGNVVKLDQTGCLPQKQVESVVAHPGKITLSLRV